MKESKRRFPARVGNPQEVKEAKVAAGGLRNEDWHQQIKRQGNAWPAKAVKLPTGEAAAVTAAGRNQTKKHTP